MGIFYLFVTCLIFREWLKLERNLIHVFIYFIIWTKFWVKTIGFHHFQRSSLERFAWKGNIALVMRYVQFIRPQLSISTRELAHISIHNSSIRGTVALTTWDTPLRANYSNPRWNNSAQALRCMHIPLDAYANLRNSNGNAFNVDPLRFLSSA